MSARLLAIENEQEQLSFILKNMSFLKSVNIENGSKFVHNNFITCMGKLYKNIEDSKSQSLLLLGTENQQIMILEPSGMAILKTFDLKAVPVFITTQGSFEVDYKIFIACRNGYTYQIKSGKISGSFKVHIESKPVGMVKLDKTLVIAAMNRNIYSFYNKGRINFTK